MIRIPPGTFAPGLPRPFEGGAGGIPPRFPGYPKPPPSRRLLRRAPRLSPFKSRR